MGLPTVTIEGSILKAGDEILRVTTASVIIFVSESLGVVTSKKRELDLLDRPRNLGYVIPTGMLREGENVWSGAMREAEEEAGVKLEREDLVFFGWREFTSRDGKGTGEAHVYFLTILDQPPVLREKELCIEDEELSPTEILNLREYLDFKREGPMSGVLGHKIAVALAVSHLEKLGMTEKSQSAYFGMIAHRKLADMKLLEAEALQHSMPHLRISPAVLS